MMAKRWYLNFFLFLFLVGSYFFLQYQSSQNSQHIIASQLSKQSVLNIDEMIFSYTALDEKKHTLAFSKKNGYWAMLKPAYAYANHIRINHLLIFLQEQVSAGYDAQGRDLSTFGLLAPKITAQYNNERFLLGSRNPTRRQRYVLHNGKIKLLSESISASIRSSLSGFVAHRLFPPNVTIIKIESSLLFNMAHLEQSSALALSDYEKEDEVINQLTVYLSNQQQIHYDVLKSDDNKLLILGRSDLKVKYTLNLSQVIDNN